MGTLIQILTGFVQEIQLRVTAQAVARGSLIGRELKLDRFEGSGHHRWSYEIKATVGTKQTKLLRALKWAERQRDNAVDPAVVAAEHLERYDNEALRSFMLARPSYEPRAITQNCTGNDQDAWQWVQNRFESNRLHATLRPWILGRQRACLPHQTMCRQAHKARTDHGCSFAERTNQELHRNRAGDAPDADEGASSWRTVR